MAQILHTKGRSRHKDPYEPISMSAKGFQCCSPVLIFHQLRHSRDALLAQLQDEEVQQFRRNEVLREARGNNFRMQNVGPESSEDVKPQLTNIPKMKFKIYTQNGRHSPSIFKMLGIHVSFLGCNPTGFCDEGVMNFPGCKVWTFHFFLWLDFARKSRSSASDVAAWKLKWPRSQLFNSPCEKWK